MTHAQMRWALPVVAIATLVMTGCHGAGPLRKDVQAYCEDQAGVIAVALTEAHEGQGKPPPTGDAPGGANPVAAFRAFSFCSQVRAVDEAEQVKARSEFQHAAGALVSARTTGSNANDKARLEALETMSALYRKVNAWPLK